jgi:hypothetical protein
LRHAAALRGAALAVSRLQVRGAVILLSLALLLVLWRLLRLG